MEEKLIKEDLKITDEGKLYELRNGTWVEYEYVIFDKKKCSEKMGNLMIIFQGLCTLLHIKRNTEYYNLIK